mmetsp:Transcript_30687/g.62645  ORF Transcript_30687/g.62645 Transcript_30687/m.62645 type:complete len:327 (-) Transcript_30687:325-1305(-)|eukprot:CAMPEP_0182543488 /NCGR_PEP_ID=MMETSP1323-20130603/31732_1 /TAXON_ID=236787 /ORGANISM="Florenciella parvula, Strain RCC1693" /LENGTH=326 /DNA_ID=CAMNT_0024754429 /DNA_START=150 /DNA_END=1130 /DNA_ORIENTATION=+
MGKGEGKGRGKGGDDGAIIIGAGCCLMWLIIACVLLGTSFDVIKPTEVGIRYSDPGNRMLYDEGVYKNGRHCLAPGHEFKKFTTQLKYVGFMGGGRLACWTKDKQEVNLELGIYYQIDPKGVIKLYKKYGNKYLVVWKAMMQQAIKQSTKYFDTTSFFDDRNQILRNISSAIINQLTDQHVQNVSVIMGNVQIPEAFEAAVTTKVVTQQSEITKLTSRNYTLVLADTTLVNADAQKRVRIIEANANAKAQVIIAEAAATAETLREQAYAESYAYVRDTLGFNDTFVGSKAQNDKLFKYIWAKSLKDQNGGSKLVVGFDGTSIKTSS